MDNHNHENGCGECEKHGIVFDMERMKEAMESESFTMPPNLTKDEKRQFIINCARDIK